MLIAVNSGTTNTRFYLLKNDEVLASVKESVGIRDCAIAGGNERYKGMYRQGIAKLIEKQGVKETDISRVVVSGMATASAGLLEVPHVSAPVNQAELARRSCVVRLGDISDIPFMFIPGVKNRFEEKPENLNLIDMMRGEETETIGLLRMMAVRGAAAVLFPGSHTKLVITDERHNICACHTSMGGELIAGISRHTVLAESLAEPVIQKVIPEFLIKGFEYAGKYGIGDAVFRVRLSDVLHLMRTDERANFFTGAVLRTDILMAERYTRKDAVILYAGSNPLKEVFGILLEYRFGENRLIQSVSDEISELCSPVGSYLIEKEWREHGAGKNLK